MTAFEKKHIEKNSLGMEFVLIKPGSFKMGTSIWDRVRRRHEKKHTVTLTKHFYMQTTPVTQGQWKAVMGENPSKFWDGGDNSPVEMVSWHDAQEFIWQLNISGGIHRYIYEGLGTYRLPTEAQWEYTCRSGTNTRYFFGNNENDLSDYAWFSENSARESDQKKFNIWNRRTHTVAQKNPNAWGLFDMYGNVAEWCLDCCDWDRKKLMIVTDTYANCIINPVCRVGEERIIRGGSFFSHPLVCRSAKRSCYHPDDYANNIGFRLVMEINEKRPYAKA